MQIHLDIVPGPGGRLIGSASIPGGDDVAFSGSLELLAAVEGLCHRTDPETVPSGGRPDPKDPS